MSSRWPDLVRLLLATFLEALWFGALAALLVAAPPAPVILLCWAVVAGAALLAAAARGAAAALGAAPAPAALPPAAARPGLRRRRRPDRHRVAAGAGAESWPWSCAARSSSACRWSSACSPAAPRSIPSGRSNARCVPSPSSSPSCSSRTPRGSLWPGRGSSSLSTVLAGLALVAVARALVTLRAIEGRRSVWRWTAGVVAAGLLALAVAALIAALPAGGALASLGGLVLVVLHGLLDVVGYVIAGIGYLVLRAVVALASAVHLHPHLPQLRPPSTWHLNIVKQPQTQTHPRSGVREVLGIVVLVALALLAVRLLLRSFRIERDSADETAVEEREQLVRPAAEMRAAGRRLVDRLSRLVRGGRPRTPTEALRAEYRRLERSLPRNGYVREPSWSARRYLGSLSGEAGDGGPERGAAVARLVTLYERARYADDSVDWPEVDEFKKGRRALLAALPV